MSTDDEPTAVYEIRLRGAHPENLRRQFPTAAVVATPIETVLFRHVEEPAELDALIAKLLSLGLVLTEVHEMRLGTPARVDAEAVDVETAATEKDGR